MYQKVFHKLQKQAWQSAFLIIYALNLREKDKFLIGFVKKRVQKAVFERIFDRKMGIFSGFEAENRVWKRLEWYV